MLTLKKKVVNFPSLDPRLLARDIWQDQKSNNFLQGIATLTAETENIFCRSV